MLYAENFKTTVNFPSILALATFFTEATIYTGDASFAQTILQNEAALTYFATGKGFVNTGGYFQKNPTYYDVRNHLQVIEMLLLSHYKEHQVPANDAKLRDTLCEYLLNETYGFREHHILSCLEKVSATAKDSFILNFLKSLQAKVKEVSQRPPAYNREDAPL